MKNKLLYILCILCAAMLAAVPLGACTESPSGAAELDLLAENIVDDSYDNYYEIFVYSFCDSNGDGYGDLDGVTSKLDYIRDMGYTGIWLMPICDSPSYHGYDVRDYYKVNSKYGTLEDFGELTQAAHERGIKVITDLVVNHTSSSNQWFVNSVNSRNGVQGADAKYRDWYNYSSTERAGYHKNGSVYYEGRFDGGMPDLNLDNEDVRAEIDNIIKFWLEQGADGFRLDGCLYYYTGDRQKSADFCGWIKDTAEKYNPEAYIVGEMWDGMSTGSLTEFYKCGADSFFCFPSHGADGYVNKSINGRSAATYLTSVQRVYDIAGGYIPAPFLDNHDVGRIAGVMGRNADKIKFAYGLLSMYNGNTFTYYGDEIGMIGSASDPDKRVGMLWDNNKTNLTRTPPGAKTPEYVFDGVKEQLADENSILNYYKLCNNARNAFPAIMRGVPEAVTYSDPNVAILKKTYNDSTVTIAINLSENAKTVTGIAGKLAQSICVKGSISFDGQSLEMPGRSIAILT